MSGENPSVNGEKKDTRIKPGEVRNPAGRPKGARSKLGEAFLKELLADFEQHGVEAIKATREDKPDQYLKVVASILPKEIEPGPEFAEMVAKIAWTVVDPSNGA